MYSFELVGRCHQ